MAHQRAGGGFAEHSTRTAADLQRDHQARLAHPALACSLVQGRGVLPGPAKSCRTFNMGIGFVLIIAGRAGTCWRTSALGESAIIGDVIRGVRGEHSPEVDNHRHRLLHRAWRRRHRHHRADR